MANQTIPVATSTGQLLVDTSIIPFIRRSDIEFSANDLKPYKEANFFFDETDVSRFVQRPSELVMVANGTTSGVFSKKESFINETTGAYFSVLDYNANNTLYLNENYVTLNVEGVLLASGDYSSGDIIYQNGTSTAGISSNTFSGKVIYWNSTKKWLVVSVNNGTINSTSTTSNTIFKVGGRTSTVVSVLGNTAIQRFASGEKFSSVTDSSKYDYVSAYTNYSGQITFANGSLTSIVTSSNVSSSALAGKYVKIVSGTGVGQYRLITSVSSNTIINFSSPLSVAVTGDSRYSLTNSTVDEYGKISGVFNIPEDPLMKFKTGERLFTITDSTNYLNPDAEMKASAKYVASGLLNKSQEIKITPVVVQIPTPAPGQPPVAPPKRTDPPSPTVITPEQPTPVRRRRRRDPVAQTFFTPEPSSIKQNYGIFVTSVDLFFKEKPQSFAPQLPVTVRIVSTVNGYPTESIIAAATVYPDKVNVTNGTSTLPSITDSTTYTKFTFANPVYLEPSTEYAIVVFSESPDYSVWISELGETVLGTTRRVSEQPYAGSFFRSQNASTWTPFQNQDLMFVINRAVFSSDQAVVTFNAAAPEANVNLDELIVHSTDLNFPVANIRYSAYTTFSKDASADPSYIDIVPNEYYSFGSDLKNSSKTNNRRRVILGGNSSSFTLQVTLSSSDNAVSPMFNTERLSLIGIENLINKGEISNSNITITSGGGKHYAANVANITVSISAPQLSNGVQATANVLTSGITATGNIIALNITNGGSGYVESPTVAINDTTPGVTVNATAIITSEDKSFGGNAKARYLTRKITLADGFDAGDLRVFLRGVRPSGTEILVYYKVLSATDPDNFFDKKWKRMSIVKDIYSPDQETSIELQYRPNLVSGKLSYTENDVEYPLGGKFKNFAIKIVMLAGDTTVIPYVTNIRAIATPEG
jgi:hypothetical protein